MRKSSFVAHLSTLYKAHTQSKVLSKQAQSDSDLIIDVPFFYDPRKQSFIKL